MVGAPYVLSFYLQGKNDLIEDGAMIKPSVAYRKKHANTEPFDLDAELKRMDERSVWKDDWKSKPVPGLEKKNDN